MGNDSNGLVEALLGLPGFRVLAVAEGPSELVVTVETVLDRVGCTNCGVRAEAQDRMAMAVRDLACFGRPVRLVWIKRRWRCVDVDCSARRGPRHPSMSAPRLCSPDEAEPRRAGRWVSWPGRW
ncbi:MAG: transposase family protein [Actinobacteria bacterium]|nr:transposase family protein [Actinomycetota bacterium]